MKLLLTVVCLMASMSFASCLVNVDKYRAGLMNVARFFQKAKESQESVLFSFKADVGGDPSRCINDYTQMSSDHFIQCQGIFDAFGGSNFNLTAAHSFCQGHCASFLYNLMKKLIHDCDLPQSQLPDSNDLMLLNHSCFMSPSQGHYCIEEWGLLSDPSHIPTDYADCLAHFDGHGSCPNACKAAEQWVLTHMGCCYRTILDYQASAGETDGLLLEDYWHACGLKEPGACH